MELLGEGRTRMQEGQRGWSDPGKRYRIERAKYWQEVIAMPWVKEMTNLLESIKPIRRLQSDKMLAPRGRDVIEEEASWRKFVHYRKYSVIACIRLCVHSWLWHTKSELQGVKTHKENILRMNGNWNYSDLMTIREAGHNAPHLLLSISKL